MFAAAAAAVLVVSFVALASLWSTPRLQEPRERRLVRLPLVVDAVLGVWVGSEHWRRCETQPLLPGVAIGWPRRVRWGF